MKIDSDNNTLQLKVAAENFNFGISYEMIGRWLPYPTDPTTIEDFLGNISLYRKSLPVTIRDLLYYQAYMRELLRQQTSSEIDNHQNKIAKIAIPIQVLTLSPQDAHAVMIFLDGYTPINVVELFDDKDRVATCISPICKNQKHMTSGTNLVASINLNLGLTAEQKIDLEKDQIIFVPTKKTQPISLEFKSNNKWTLFGSEKISLEVFGGRFGLVFDMRGRPFEGPTFNSDGRSQLVSWWESIGIGTESF